MSIKVCQCHLDDLDYFITIMTCDALSMWTGVCYGRVNPGSVSIEPIRTQK